MLYRPSEGGLITKVGGSSVWVLYGGSTIVIDTPEHALRITLTPQLRVCRPAKGLVWAYVAMGIPIGFILNMIAERLPLWMNP